MRLSPAYQATNAVNNAELSRLPFFMPGVVPAMFRCIFGADWVAQHGNNEYNGHLLVLFVDCMEGLLLKNSGWTQTKVTLVQPIAKSEDWISRAGFI